MPAYLCVPNGRAQLLGDERMTSRPAVSSEMRFIPMVSVMTSAANHLKPKAAVDSCEYVAAVIHNVTSI